MRLDVHTTDAVILTRKVAGSFGFLSSIPSLLVGFSIQDEAMGVAQSAPQMAHCDVIYLLGVYGTPTQALYGSRPTIYIPR